MQPCAEVRTVVPPHIAGSPHCEANASADKGTLKRRDRKSQPIFCKVDDFSQGQWKLYLTGRQLADHKRYGGGQRAWR